ncbi:MAG: hypothetical protein GX119_11950 [Syntrophomonadaceae bacterium]|jgi:hypothetical protein|nr:hypothetical protein [Syntrophomonadaceae bacterium]
MLSVQAFFHAYRALLVSRRFCPKVIKLTACTYVIIKEELKIGVELMRNYKKLFIGVIVLVNILLAVGIYTNYQLNHRGMLSHPEMVSTDHDGHQPTGENNTNSPSNLNNSQNIAETEGQQTWWTALLNRFNHSEAGEPSAADKPSNEDVIKLAEKQLGQSVDKGDVAKVGAILIKRLNSEELSFIYKMTQESKPSSADIKKAKQILQNKLTSEELQLVHDVALKYGKKINF